MFPDNALIISGSYTTVQRWWESPGSLRGKPRVGSSRILAIVLFLISVLSAALLLWPYVTSHGVDIDRLMGETSVMATAHVVRSQSLVPKAPAVVSQPPRDAEAPMTLSMDFSARMAGDEADVVRQEFPIADARPQAIEVKPPVVRPARTVLRPVDIEPPSDRGADETPMSSIADLPMVQAAPSDVISNYAIGQSTGGEIVRHVDLAGQIVVTSRRILVFKSDR